ncbi:hypothetical protein PRIPAC_93149 [Pristionchus pacificus]|uniref:Uncharacterized protein n=1 Tax=Pristionchus pacificus TaxID=54126 RepID=A0A2A6CDF7_PRIPA|nr:hypothetical protein PRIPAC_93149 [Pristionchus pacificus]|eukprot:PDM76234.1 hypothetical protein PRIPAC_39838 [Pristionchus pacificus]
MFQMLRLTLTTLTRASALPRIAATSFSTSQRLQNEQRQVKFVTTNGVHIGKANLGDSLLDVVVNNDLPLDGFGACEGTLACCTCHVVLSPDHFARVDKVNPACEEEMDLLDLAPALSDESRLGCQIKLDKSDPFVLEVTVPEVTRDARTLD